MALSRSARRLSPAPSIKISFQPRGCAWSRRAEVSRPKLESLSTRDSGCLWTLRSPVSLYFYLIFSGLRGEPGRPRKSLEMRDWWDGGPPNSPAECPFCQEFDLPGSVDALHHCPPLSVAATGCTRTTIDASSCPVLSGARTAACSPQAEIGISAVGPETAAWPYQEQPYTQWKAAIRIS
jgi:hypothetical protein